MRKSLVALVLGAFVCVAAGCSNFSGINIPTEKKVASICLDGPVAIPCTELGEVTLPSAGTALDSFVVLLAAPYLKQQKDFKNCLINTYPAVVDKVISVTVTANCDLNGIPVTQNLTVKLAPVEDAE